MDATRTIMFVSRSAPVPQGRHVLGRQGAAAHAPPASAAPRPDMDQGARVPGETDSPAALPLVFNHQPGTIRFEPVGAEDLELAAPERASPPPEPRPRSSAEPRARTHVSSCTCAHCQRRRAAARRLPADARAPLLLFKLNRCGSRLVRATLMKRGFRETAKDTWNVLWTSAHLKSYHFQVRCRPLGRGALTIRSARLRRACGGSSA